VSGIVAFSGASKTESKSCTTLTEGRGQGGEEELFVRTFIFLVLLCHVPHHLFTSKFVNALDQGMNTKGGSITVLLTGLESAI